MVTTPILTPGQSVGGVYRITQLLSTSPAAESYLALHTQKQTRVILTCSIVQRQGNEPFSLASAAFRKTVTALRALTIDTIAKVCDGGVEERPELQGRVHWVAREHLEDAMSLDNFMGGAPVNNDGLAATRALLQAHPAEYRVALALAVGIATADALGQAASQGILHGGLDPRKTVALRGDGTPFLFDVGYHSLFGAAHCSPLPDEPDVRAPEQRAGNRPDVQSDIYALGATMLWLISGFYPDDPQARPLFERASNGKLGLELAMVINVIARAMEVDPKNRFSSWDSLHDTLSVLSESIMARLGAKLQQDKPASSAPIEGHADAERVDAERADAEREDAVARIVPRSEVSDGQSRDVPPAPAPLMPRRSLRPLALRSLGMMLAATLVLLIAFILGWPQSPLPSAAIGIRAAYPIFNVPAAPASAEGAHGAEAALPAPPPQREADGTRRGGSGPRFQLERPCGEWARCPQTKPRIRRASVEISSLE